MRPALEGRASLAWRLRQQALDVPASTGVVGVAERVLAARAWPLDLAELAFGARQADPEVGGVGRALEGGELVQSYAFRGGSYVFTPAIAAVLLTVRTTSRVWETRRYQSQIGHEIDDWEPLREAVREALGEGPATRAEIADHLRRSGSLAHLAEAAATGAGADSLFKPLHWWGDIAFGPPRQGQSTFRLLGGGPGSPGVPDVDDAGRSALRLYLRRYGPATAANLRYWLGEGLSVPTRRLAGWLEDVGGDITAVTVDGIDAYALTETLDDLRAAEPSELLTLVPGFDPWVLGPGTADARIVPPRRRHLFSNGAAPVLRGGHVSGTWRRHGPTVAVEWFEEVGAIPSAELEGAVRRLSQVAGTDLSLR